MLENGKANNIEFRTLNDKFHELRSNLTIVETNCLHVQWECQVSGGQLYKVQRKDLSIRKELNQTRQTKGFEGTNDKKVTSKYRNVFIEIINISHLYTGISFMYYFKRNG